MALTTIDDRGLKTPIDLLDNEKIRFGTGNDLEVYHSGSDSWIKHDGTGLLVLATADLQVTNVAGSEQMIRATADGSVQLFYNNTKQFETIDGGIRVSDNQDIQAGTSGDLLLKHDGSNSWIKNLTGVLVAATADFQVASVAGDEQMIRAYDDGAVELYYDNSKKFETTASGVQLATSTNNHGITLESTNTSYPAITFDANRSGADQFLGQLIGKWNGNTVANIIFETGQDTTNKDDGVITFRTAGERFRIENTGVTVSGGEGEHANLYLYADEGDDNADKLRIQQSSTGDLWIENYASGSWEAHLKASGNGGVELYYDNVKKAQTYANGLELMQNLYMQTGGQYLSDNVKIHIGNSNDLQIYHDGSSSHIQNATGDLIQKSTGWIAHACDNGQYWYNHAINTAYARLDSDGLKFNGDTAAANGLDDYEEGTWTPTVAGSPTDLSVSGEYRKIGKMVSFNGFVSLTSHSNSSTTHISGLPFSGISNKTFSVTVGNYRYLNLDGGYNQFMIDMAGTTMTLREQGDNTNYQNISWDQISNDFQVYFSGVYYTA